MCRAPSPHMVLALQAGLVSQELLGALTAVDDDLCSACLFAEYWDTHSDRDAWLRQHLASQFHSLAVLLHQWCCEQSASWARGAVHIPAFRSPVSCKTTAPSSFATAGGNGSKRRHAAITSGGRHRQRQSSSQPPDGPLLSKAAREHEEYQQVLEVTLNLISVVGPLTWTHSGAQLFHIVFGRASLLAFAKSFRQPRHQLVRFEHITCRSSGFCCGGADRKLSPSECFLKAANIDVPVFMEKLAAPGSSVPKSTASSLAWWVKFLDVPASFFIDSEYHHG